MARNKVEIQDGELVVTPRGLDKMWSFKREIRVPLTCSRSNVRPGCGDGTEGIPFTGAEYAGQKGVSDVPQGRGTPLLERDRRIGCARDRTGSDV